MQMNPKYYFDNFVIPNYDEFCADEGNVRKAFNAVVSLFHMTDNYFNFYSRRQDVKVAAFKDLKDFQIHMGGLTPYFNDIQSMANAYKHLYTNSGKAHVTVESGGAVYLREVTENDDGTDTEDLEGASCRVVYYSKKDGSNFEVKEALTDVVKAWGNLL